MSTRPALWGQVQDARANLDRVADVLEAVAEEAYLRQNIAPDPGKITGPKPSSAPPPTGDPSARADYGRIFQSLARADCLLEMAAAQSPRLAYRRSRLSRPASQSLYRPSVQEGVMLCQRLRSGLQTAHDVRVERPESTRRLRESLRAIHRAHGVARGYRTPPKGRR